MMDEPQFVPVAQLADLQPGTILVVNIEDERIALVVVEEQVYAFRDYCTHRACYLSEGKLAGLAVICTCHGSVFDIRTGEVLEPPAKRPLKVFPVRIVEEMIELQLHEAEPAAEQV